MDKSISFYLLGDIWNFDTNHHAASVAFDDCDWIK